MRRTCSVKPPRSMSPLPVSRSTSAPAVGGIFSVTSPEPVSMWTERNVATSATSTSPLPVSNDRSSPDDAVASILPDPVSTCTLGDLTSVSVTPPEPAPAAPAHPTPVAVADPAAAVVTPTFSPEGPVVAHAQGGVPAAAPVGHHDVVVGIDDPQRLAAAQRPRLHLELGRVGATALDLDSYVAARAGFDAQLTDEAVDGDGIAFEDLT